jgi:hypothetical protein
MAANFTLKKRVIAYRIITHRAIAYSDHCFAKPVPLSSVRFERE